MKLGTTLGLSLFLLASAGQAELKKVNTTYAAYHFEGVNQLDKDCEYGQFKKHIRAKIAGDAGKAAMCNDCDVKSFEKQMLKLQYTCKGRWPTDDYEAIDQICTAYNFAKYREEQALEMGFGSNLTKMQTTERDQNFKTAYEHYECAKNIAHYQLMPSDDFSIWTNIKLADFYRNYLDRVPTQAMKSYFEKIQLFEHNAFYNGAVRHREENPELYVLTGVKAVKNEYIDFSMSSSNDSESAMNEYFKIERNAKDLLQVATQYDAEWARSEAYKLANVMAALPQKTIATYRLTGSVPGISVKHSTEHGVGSNKTNEKVMKLAMDPIQEVIEMLESSEPSLDRDLYLAASYIRLGDILYAGSQREHKYEEVYKKAVDIYNKLGPDARMKKEEALKAAFLSPTLTRSRTSANHETPVVQSAYYGVEFSLGRDGLIKNVKLENVEPGPGSLKDTLPDEVESELLNHYRKQVLYRPRITEDGSLVKAETYKYPEHFTDRRYLKVIYGVARN
jgi:hypothetical protein